jgi:hypothetical protein
MQLTGKRLANDVLCARVCCMHLSETCQLPVSAPRASGPSSGFCYVLRYRTIVRALFINRYESRPSDIYPPTCLCMHVTGTCTYRVGCCVPCVNAFGSLQPMVFGSAMVPFLAEVGTCGINARSIMDKSRPNARQSHLIDLPLLLSPMGYFYRFSPRSPICQTLQLSSNMLRVF